MVPASWGALANFIGV